MADYEMRVDYSDETSAVVTIPADTIGEAVAIANRDPDVVAATCLCRVDRDAPQVYLAGGHAGRPVTPRGSRAGFLAVDLPNPFAGTAGGGGGQDAAALERGWTWD